MNRPAIPAIALLLAAVVLALAPASALSPLLEKAKADGVIGEQADGYLGFVKGNGPANVEKAMQEVNVQRKALYRERAKQKGTDVKTYAAVVGKTQIARESKGNWVKGDKGWVRK